jgi:single-strand DNA-binding protein
MQALMNSVRLIGNVGTEPELRELSEGKKIAKIRLATNERVRTKDGLVSENTQWHNLVAWDALADVMVKYIAKGSKVAVEGRLNHQVYTDSEGQRRERSEIVVSSFLTIDGKKPEIA